MTIPITGLVCLFGVLIFFLLAQKFWRHYKIEGNDIAKIFSWSFFSLGINYLIDGVPCLLLIDNRTVWQFLNPIHVFFLGMGYVFILYVVVRQKLKKYTRWFLGIFFILLIYAVVGSVINPPIYFYTNGVLNWDVSKTPVLLNSIIILIFFLPTTVFFFHQAETIKDKRAKIRSLGLGLSMFFVIVSNLFDLYLLGPSRSVLPVYADLNLFVMFSVLAITLFITWGPPKPKYVTKIE